MTLDETANLLRQYSFAAASEATLHHAVHGVFLAGGIPVEPERILSARDRIDFYLPDSQLGIECKIDGSPSEVMRQLLRYTESPEIAGLILVTSRTKHRSIPPTLGGKPVRVVLTRLF